MTKDLYQEICEQYKVPFNIKYAFKGDKWINIINWSIENNRLDLFDAIYKMDFEFNIKKIVELEIGYILHSAYAKTSVKTLKHILNKINKTLSEDELISSIPAFTTRENYNLINFVLENSTHPHIKEKISLQAIKNSSLSFITKLFDKLNPECLWTEKVNYQYNKTTQTFELNYNMLEESITRDNIQIFNYVLDHYSNVKRMDVMSVVKKAIYTNANKVLEHYLINYKDSLGQYNDFEAPYDRYVSEEMFFFSESNNNIKTLKLLEKYGFYSTEKTVFLLVKAIERCDLDYITNFLSEINIPVRKKEKSLLPLIIDLKSMLLIDKLDITTIDNYENKILNSIYYDNDKSLSTSLFVEDLLDKYVSIESMKNFFIEHQKFNNDMTWLQKIYLNKELKENVENSRNLVNNKKIKI